MNSLHDGPVATTLQRIRADAERADGALIAQLMDTGVEQALRQLAQAESGDLATYYHTLADNYLSVTPAFGQFLYACARARKATRIVEFGTSMGISTIYLAAALRDMGGGQVIGTELEASKAARAREHLAAAGLEDLVEIRVGDARTTLQDIDGPIDLVLLDGAFTLYLPVLKLLEPQLAPGAIVVAENAFEQTGGDYLAYVRDAANGYLSQPLPIAEGRGNEFTVVVR